MIFLALPRRALSELPSSTLLTYKCWPICFPGVPRQLWSRLFAPQSNLSGCLEKVRRVVYGRFDWRAFHRILRRKKVSEETELQHRKTVIGVGPRPLRPGRKVASGGHCHNRRPILPSAPHAWQHERVAHHPSHLDEVSDEVVMHIVSCIRST
jgi:hypothetical protein